MFVDASALVGILAREIDAPTLAGRLGEAERIFTSPVAIYEAVLGLARARNMSIGDAERVVANFLIRCPGRNYPDHARDWAGCDQCV